MHEVFVVVETPRIGIWLHQGRVGVVEFDCAGIGLATKWKQYIGIGKIV